MIILRNLLVKSSLILTITAGLMACSDSMSSKQGEAFKDGSSSGDKEVSAEFDQLALLTDLSNNVFLPKIESFKQTSANLVNDISSYCDTLTSANSGNTTAEQVTTAQNQAQQSWQTTMAEWQHIEMMQVGPLAFNDGNLRNNIYSWPFTNYCAVDQDVGHYEAGEINGQDYDISRRTSNRKGLTTIEYLLYNPNMDHACSKDSLAPDNWNARSEQSRQLARCEFATEVARDINNNASVLQQAWLNSDDGYQRHLLEAGQPSSDYDSAHKAINAITDGMFYLDSITKDEKLGAPIGLFDNSCGNMACVSDLESNLADIAIDNVLNNMLAFKALFHGTYDTADTALGFDDFLIAVDASDLASQMTADIDAAITLLQAFDGSSNATVSNNPETIQDMYVAVKKVTDSLKSLFITNLALELPQTSAGDAD